MGSALPPFQSTMTSGLGHTGMSPAMDTQKSSGLFGGENKTTSNMSGSNTFKTSDPFSSGGPGIPSMDHSTGIRTLHSGFNGDALEEELLYAYLNMIETLNTEPYKDINSPLKC